MALLETSPLVAKLQFAQIIKFVLQKHNREISLLAHTAKSRYQHFLRERGELFNRIPHNVIASYLKLTPETLSRLRKQNLDVDQEI